ncbi:MAG: ribose-phosphate pyrophosphokinae [Bacteroidota bacterium]|jgi:ribose-phosphate pyrophosphokinase|nr:ribose-phosphate pyrophosphokinae [Bacteroidota bacterium]
MKPIVLSLPGNELLAQKIIVAIQADKAEYELRSFPDGETYLRVLSDVAERDIILVCTLYQPDSKLLPLLFLCRLLKDLKVKSICLVSPYLAYMRQDKQFKSGEAVTSGYFASVLSGICDRLITIDPHLHRRVSMKEIYSIPCDVLHAASIISKWIKANIPDALVIGPDSESEQWVSEVAKNAEVPFVILEKVRHGDKEVKVSVPQVDGYKAHTPVLVDDIISTARTMIETVSHLKNAGMRAPVCIGVHAVFAGNAYADLRNAGVAKIVTCNSITHETNEIDISEILIHALRNKTMFNAL